MERKKSALVTGGAGFIGSHMTDVLIADGWSVTVLDNLSTGSADNLSHLCNDSNLTFVHGDVENVDLLRKELSGIDAVFHFAALVSVPLSIERPAECHRINVNAFNNLLLELKNKKIPVLYASSASVYGNRDGGVRHENESPLPLSPYGASKAMNEIQAAMAWNVWKIPAVGFRFFNGYGPRQDPDGAYASVIPRFCDALARGKRPVVYGDGSQTRDFIHVKDLAQVLLRMSSIAYKLGGRVFNVATGNSLSVRELLRLIADKMDKFPNEERLPERKGDIRHSQADIEALKKELGPLSFRNINDGLDDTIEWYVRSAQKGMAG